MQSEYMPVDVLGCFDVFDADPPDSKKSGMAIKAPKGPKILHDAGVQAGQCQVTAPKNTEGNHLAMIPFPLQFTEVFRSARLLLL